MDIRNPDKLLATAAVDSALKNAGDAQSFPTTPDQFDHFDGAAGTYRGPVLASIDDSEHESVQADDLARWTEAQGDALSTSVAGQPVASNVGAASTSRRIRSPRWWWRPESACT